MREEVESRGKFNKEFGVEEDAAEIHPNMPEDYKAMFDGNIDDCFRLGLRFTRRSIKLGQLSSPWTRKASWSRSSLRSRPA